MGSLITLAEKAAVIVLAGYIVSRASFMRPYVEEKPTNLRSHLLLGLVFGLFSIYGTLGGIHLGGAVINIRDVGPLIAGLVGGPVPGLIAGVIGGGHRLLTGLLDWEALGFTAIPCSLSTLLIGIIAGWIRHRYGLVRPLPAVLIAAISEAGHNGLAVLLAGAPAQMLQLETMRFTWNNITRHAALPMILANSLGVGIFFAVFYLYRRELRAFRERDTFYQEVEQRNTELRSAYQIAQAITASSIDPDETLQTILERVRQMIPYGGAEICFYVPEEQSLRVQAWAGDDAFNAQDRLYRIGGGFTGWIGEQRRSLLLPDMENLPSVEPELSLVEEESPIQSYVGVPLLVGDQLVGTLELASAQAGVFDEHTKRLLETIAPQAAIAIHNARRVRRREESLRRQIKELRIEINEARRRRQVAEITETEYFRELQEKGERFRERSREEK